uniref:UBX domain-containing protein n=1 Tax=Rhodosorus marinus TaxID=101924 RepID=A0A7S3A6K2_9RHOD|mmetsp:Transcript_5347/g.22660  ORF Transcript_5347/g.22660 Transcript_5347/m.22660 type:complete len:542 (+) Transcript_5347:104-1729(+)
MSRLISEVVEEFQKITGSDDEYARWIVEKNGSVLQDSLTEHFGLMDSLGMNSVTMNSPPAAVEAEAAGTGQSSAAVQVDSAETREEDVAMDDDDDDDDEVEVVSEHINSSSHSSMEEKRSSRSALVDSIASAAPRQPARALQEQGRRPFPSSENAANGSSERGGLDELFRAPVEITFTGEFDRAMSYAEERKRLLLVNIQSPEEFKCQVLNRDLWKNDAVSSVIQGQLVFWQRNRETEDGRLFAARYPVPSVPYVVMIDPRSGETLMELTDGTRELVVDEFLTKVLDFLSSDDLWSQSRPPATQTSLREVAPLPSSQEHPTGATAATSGEVLANSAETDFRPQMDLDEDLARAIEASLDADGTSADTSTPRMISRQQSAANPELQNQRSVRETQDLEYEMSLAEDRAREESLRQEQLREIREMEERERKAKEVQEDQERRVREAKERRDTRLRRLPEEPPVKAPNSTALAIRIPDGDRISRRFNATDTLDHVFEFVEATTDLDLSGYEVMAQFPRKVFRRSSETLREAGLIPNGSLIVHLP